MSNLQPELQQQPNKPQHPTTRGLQLMEQHAALISLVAKGEVGIEKLDAWHCKLGNQDFDEWIEAERAMSRNRLKEQRQAMALVYEEPAQVGRGL